MREIKSTSVPLCLCESFLKLSFNELSREYSAAVQTGIFRVCGTYTTDGGKDRKGVL